jgi:hypothetical protein
LRGCHLGGPPWVVRSLIGAARTHGGASAASTISCGWRLSKR